MWNVMCFYIIALIQSKAAAQTSKGICLLQRANVRWFRHFIADKSDHPLKSHMYCLRMKWPPFWAELVSKTMDAALIPFSIYKTASDGHHTSVLRCCLSPVNKPCNIVLQHRKCVCMEFFLKVPVFHAAICLSAGFSLFNQSNMKQEIWSLPRDIHPLRPLGSDCTAF